MTDQLIATPIESAEIERILPHRYPFLLIDRVISYTLEPEITLTAIKNEASTSRFLQDISPGIR